MNYERKILIGGQALKQLGSTRNTDDFDYLVFDEENYKDQFIFDRDNNVDYMNGNASNFSEDIYNKEKGNEVATPQSLFELKMFAAINQLYNNEMNKLNTNLHDLNFLAINFEVDTNCPTLSKYHSVKDIQEIKKMLLKTK